MNNAGGPVGFQKGYKRIIPEIQQWTEVEALC